MLGGGEKVGEGNSMVPLIAGLGEKRMGLQTPYLFNLVISNMRRYHSQKKEVDVLELSRWVRYLIWGTGNRPVHTKLQGGHLFSFDGGGLKC